MDIFVGNLSFEATEGDVKKLFEGFGNVLSVVIVMEKEKTAPKSRGFGFVQMPDEAQALAAITALNANEFMGRSLNVSSARPKPEARDVVKLKEHRPPKVKAKVQEYPREEREEKKIRFNPAPREYPALKDRRVRPSGQPGTYKGGRRTHSYIKRQGLAGVQEEAKPKRGYQDNPMRWRKKKDQKKPWQKGPGEHKSREKTEGEAHPWKKSAGESKPWKKTQGESKPWVKSGEPEQKSGLRGSRKPHRFKR